MMNNNRLFVVLVTGMIGLASLNSKAAQFDATMNLLDMLDKQIKAQEEASQKEIQEAEKASQSMLAKVEKEQAKVSEMLQSLEEQSKAKTLDRQALQKTLKQLEKVKGKATRAIKYIDQNFTDQEVFIDQKNQQLLDEIAQYLETSIERAREILRKDKDNDLKSFLKTKKRRKK